MIFRLAKHIETYCVSACCDGMCSTRTWTQTSVNPKETVAIWTQNTWDWISKCMQANCGDERRVIVNTAIEIIFSVVILCLSCLCVKLAIICFSIFQRRPYSTDYFSIVRRYYHRCSDVIHMHTHTYTHPHTQIHIHILSSEVIYFPYKLL